MKFGYARVSTRDQNLEAQLDAGLSLGMQAFEMDQPIGESLQAAAGWLSSSASVRAT